MIERLMFIGAKNLGYSALEAAHAIAPGALNMVATVRDSKDVETRSKLADFESFAQSHGLELATLERPGDLAAVIDAYQPELCIVVGWYWFVSSELLHRVPGGFVGFHGSRLPEYRGGSPLVWALINGLTEAGMSMFYFAETMDTGDVIAQRSIQIGPEDTIAELLHAASDAIREMMAENLPLLLRGEASRSKQDEGAASYVMLRRSEDGEIDWTQSAERVYNFIRAQAHPYPGAFTTLPDGRQLHIWSADRFAAPYWGPAGKVAELRDGEAVVACGEGAVVVKTVQVAEEPETAASNVLKFGLRLGG